MSSHDTPVEHRPFELTAIFSDARAIRLAHVVSLALLLAPLCATPVLPLIDFYDHYARYYVLSHLDAPHIAANYKSAWGLLPNVGLDLIATPVAAALPPLIGAKITAAIVLLVQYAGVVFLARELRGRFDPVTPLLLISVLYSFVFTWGFANFLLGTGLAFANAALWVRLRRSAPTNLAVVVAGLGAVLVFFCHAIAFALYGVLVASVELSAWWSQGDRRLRPLLHRGLLLLAQAIVPVVLFLFSRTAGKAEQNLQTFESVRRYASDGALIERLSFEVQYRLTTILRVGEGPSLWLDAVLLLLTLCCVVYGLWRRSFTFDRRLLGALGLFAVFCAVMPPALFGVGYIADRMPLAFALAAIAGLSLSAESGKRGVILAAVIASVGAVRTAALTLEWTKNSSRFQDFLAATDGIPQGALVAGVNTYGREKRTDDGFRCEPYLPLLLPVRGAVTPLFAYKSQQPLELRGALKTARDRTRESPIPRHLPPPPGAFDAAVEAKAAAGFSYVLICGAERLTGRPLNGVTMADQAGSFRLYRRVAP